MNIRHLLRSSPITLGIVAILFFTSALASHAETDLADRSKAIASDAKEVVVDAGQSVTAGAKNLWGQIDEKGLTNRTRDEIVAWMIMGGLVGGIAGMLTSMRSTGFGRLGRLLLGLMGAFLGGLAVRLGDLNLGWGPVLIRYDELLFSFAGAVALIILSRLVQAKTRKKQA